MKYEVKKKALKILLQLTLPKDLYKQDDEALAIVMKVKQSKKMPGYFQKSQSFYL